MAELLPFPPRSHETEPLWRQLVGGRLRRMRHERRETLADVARRAGVSVQYLSEVERGLKEPSSEIVAAVLGALHGTLLDLTSGVASDLSSVAEPARGIEAPSAFRTAEPLAMAA